jgi:hypothetical protein
MDTPGAYRLVDRTTGRSVIVWGGTDDGDEAAIPSPAVLSRTTDRRRRSQGYIHIHTTPLCFFIHIQEKIWKDFQLQQMWFCNYFSRSVLVKMSALRQGNL